MIKVEKLLSELLKIPEDRITDATSMKNTEEWDSLKHIEIILAIEQSFGIELSGDEIADMISLASIKDALKRHGK